MNSLEAQASEKQKKSIIPSNPTIDQKPKPTTFDLLDDFDNGEMGSTSNAKNPALSNV